MNIAVSADASIPNIIQRIDAFWGMASQEDQALLGHHIASDSVFNRFLWHRLPSRSPTEEPIRYKARRFLSSKAGHYAILVLVSLDVSCIFADILISLFACEQSCKSGHRASKGLNDAQEALGIVSLVFSCMFMAELFANIWAFGLM